MMDEHILVVEDDPLERKVISRDLANNGFKCSLASNGEEALVLLKSETFDVLLSDQYMPRMGGIELLHNMRKTGIDLPFVMLTGEGTISDAVKSLKEGANDYLQKPYDPPTLVFSLRRAIDYFRVSRENIELKKALISNTGFESMVRASSCMEEVISLARKVAVSPGTTVAIMGESGTGKEVLARAIHSERRAGKGSFIAVNCAGIPDNLLESELFGHVKGAFTSADKEKKGKFDMASGGTLLLDEIGDFPLGMQGKLLRVLQENVYERVGGNELIKADFRFITSTHRNLSQMVKEGTFREDLYHRIMIFPITIPPLRERREDISLLSRYFMEMSRNEMGKRPLELSDEIIDFLMERPWPGNVRELKNCIERASIMSDGSSPRLEDFRLASPDTPSLSKEMESRKGDPDDENSIRFNFTLPLVEASLDNIVEEVKERVLEKCRFNKQKAARILKKNRSIFYKKK